MAIWFDFQFFTAVNHVLLLLSKARNVAYSASLTFLQLHLHRMLVKYWI